MPAHAKATVLHALGRPISGVRSPTHEGAFSAHDASGLSNDLRPPADASLKRETAHSIAYHVVRRAVHAQGKSRSAVQNSAHAASSSRHELFSGVTMKSVLRRTWHYLTGGQTGQPRITEHH